MSVTHYLNNLQCTPNPTVAYVKAMHLQNEKDLRASKEDRILAMLHRLQDDITKIKLANENVILDVHIQLEKQGALLESLQSLLSSFLKSHT